MITALTKLYKGDQVFDSYGRKDNRRLFFCYGFVEDDNQDGNGCSPNTVPVAVLPRHMTSLDGLRDPHSCVRSSTRFSPLDAEEDCGFFYNRLVLNVMENEEAQEEKAGAVGPEAAKDGSFGSVLHERSRWVCANSSVFTSNLVVMNDCTFYDHSQSQYAFLSMCHDDAGTTTIFSVIS